MINALCAAVQPPLPASPVVLMVSGGSDSTALLVRAVRGELDLLDGRGPVRVDKARLHVLHVNHCLRGAASDGDEAFVRGLCAELGVPCRVVRADVPALLADGGNMEETARLVRYEAAWQLAGELSAAAGVPVETARIAVAHTADDRAETFLMRVLTGSGAAGLTGMRGQHGIVVRPLLNETRESLRAYLRVCGTGWREDATNADTHALRSYVRACVMPSFTARNPAFAQVVGATLDVLADESDLLERLAARELAGMRRPARPGVLALGAAALAACEPALARRALRRGLAELMGEEGFRAARLEARHVEALLGLARAGTGSCTLPLGVDARVAGGVLAVALPAEWGFGPEEGAASGAGRTAPAAGVLAVPGPLTWGDGVVETRLLAVPAEYAGNAVAFARTHAQGLSATQGLVEGRDFVLADAASVGVGPQGGTLQVGSAQVGERMRPFGMAGTKLVSDVLHDAGVPRAERPWVPIVRDGAGGCVWVGGIRLDARAAYQPETSLLVELRFLHV